MRYALLFCLFWVIHTDERLFTSVDSIVVSNSILFGALGVLVVKKNNSGMELYFAHNTESFVSYLPPFSMSPNAHAISQALASFSSNAAKPSCLMSRGTRGNIAQGGCRIRFTQPCKYLHSIPQAGKCVLTDN